MPNLLIFVTLSNTMQFELTEEQLFIKQSAKDFAINECLQGVIERDEKQQFPYEQILMLADLGFMGMMIAPEYGGAGGDTVSYVMAMEEICKVDASVGVIMSVNNSLVASALQMFGTEDQKQNYLLPLAQGKKNDKLYIGAFLLSEPEAGSDATAQQTIAEDKGDYYLVNGTKNWITNGSTASVYLVVAQSNRDKGATGINWLIVDKNTEGITVASKENKMGIRASDTCTILFNDVKVPKVNRIGKEGEGFKLAMKVLSGGRIGIAAQALGIASGAYERALQYAKERHTFKQPLAQHQAIQFKLADMATRIETARLLCLKAASDKDNGLDYTQSASMAKLFASETAMWVTTEAVQIFGGYGYVKEYHVERMMRDAKITQIYEGTSEIQRIIIGKSILK